MNKVITKVVGVALLGGALATALTGCCLFGSDADCCRGKDGCGTCCTCCCEKSGRKDGCGEKKRQGVNASVTLGVGTDGVHVGSESNVGRHGASMEANAGVDEKGVSAGANAGVR